MAAPSLTGAKLFQREAKPQAFLEKYIPCSHPGMVGSLACLFLSAQDLMTP